MIRPSDFLPDGYKKTDPANTVALFHVGFGWTSVAAAGSFSVAAHGGYQPVPAPFSAGWAFPAGYGVDAAHPPEGYGTSIDVPAPGSYRVRFDGVVYSASTNADTDVIIKLFDDAVEEASHTVVRSSANPNVEVKFSTDDTLTLSGALSIRNGSPTYGQFAFGTLRVEAL